jgi:glycosyltransferase involved in cell wall biosynthesis
MRIAFVDLVFSWPPHGGADVDLYHTVQGIESLGHDVHVFVASCPESWERGVIEPSAVPFPLTKLVYSQSAIDGPTLARDFRNAVDAWRPDVVFVCDGFFLKPAVILGLKDYPLIGRYYAYEAVCIRDFLLFKNSAVCPCNYLETPNTCRTCAVAGLRDSIVRGRYLTWTDEFLKAKAYRPEFFDESHAALRALRAIVVYNDLMKRQFATVNTNVHVVPGGVNTADYEVHPPPPHEKKVILMAGRVEDPMKGFARLHAAGERLASRRNDFEIWATHTDTALDTPWFKAVGWHDHRQIRALYAQADICVTPSIWAEPFGMVAVEAMASGRPVIASRVGGLQTIVTEGETGFLYDPDDVDALAAHLETLLDDAALRQRMGQRARARAEAEYDWKRIVARYYPPLLESVT